jgi:hypothetical protein
MNTIETQQQQFARLKLKLELNRYLHKWGRQYARELFYWTRSKDEALFASVIDEMEADGTLTKETGRNGGVILVYRAITEVPPCPNS